MQPYQDTTPPQTQATQFLQCKHWLMTSTQRMCYRDSMWTTHPLAVLQMGTPHMIWRKHVYSLSYRTGEAPEAQ